MSKKDDYTLTAEPVNLGTKKRTRKFADVPGHELAEGIEYLLGVRRAVVVVGDVDLTDFGTENDDYLLRVILVDDQPVIVNRNNKRADRLPIATVCDVFYGNNVPDELNDVVVETTLKNTLQFFDSFINWYQIN